MVLNVRLKSVRNIEKITKVGLGAGLWENEAGWGMREKERTWNANVDVHERPSEEDTRL